MNTSTPTGFVFDVDGTLAVSSSAQLDALAQAATTVLGTPTEFTMRDETPYLNGSLVAGWVDAQVFGHVATSVGLDWDDVADDVLTVYETLYVDMLDGGAPAGTLLPGVADMLERLTAAGCPLALATGNTSAISRAKMTRLGVAHHFQFGPDLGFGDRHLDRTLVGRAAVASVRAALPAGSRVFLAGDTVADIVSGRANADWSVGVTTGSATGQQLLDAGAHHVLADATELLDLLGFNDGR